VRITEILLRSKKALSPVIATVILIAVTTVVAVSVAYWMGTIASSYTTFEQIELPTAYAKIIDDSADKNFTDSGWNITIELKNTGSVDATIDNIFLNGIPLKDYNSSYVCLYDGQQWLNDSSDFQNLNIHITKGSSKTIVLQVQKYDQNSQTGVEGCTSGTRIDLKLHSASGREYPVQVKLP